VKVSVYASMRHFARHVQPIFNGLPVDLCGRFETSPKAQRRFPDDHLVMVASYGDAAHVPYNKLIYVEHGAGQNYLGDPKSKAVNHYHGGELPSNVVGVIGPRRSVAASWGLPYVAAGCPVLDRFHNLRPKLNGPLTACFAFHWDATMVAPEARSAFSHYQRVLLDVRRQLEAQGIRMIGTSHPRDGSRMATFWRNIDVPYVQEPEDVFEFANMLFCDNSSLALEFASLDRPIVWLNAPWYRRDVEHGGRFWEWSAAGRQIDDPADLLTFDVRSYVTADVFAEARRKVVASVYEATDGMATVRAVDFVLERLAAM